VDKTSNFLIEKNMPRQRLIVIYAAVAIGAGAVAAHAQSALPEKIAPFLAQHCFACHSNDTLEGGLDLKAISRDVADAEVQRSWVYLYDRVASGEMPPKSDEQPTAAAKAEFLDQLGQSLANAHNANREVILRRLNRREYENSVRDMFGIYVDVKRLLPEDAAEQGFDTTGSNLSLSAEQMVLYVRAADLVLDEVFGPPRPPTTIVKTGNFTTINRGYDESERKLEDGVVLFSGAKFLPLYGMPLPGVGEYRVRVKVRAEQSERPVVMHIKGGNTGAIAAHTVGFFEAPPGEVTTVEFTDRNPERSDCFAFGIVGGFPWWSVNEKEYQGAGLFIGDIEIEGPLEPWPAPSRLRLLKGADPATASLEDIRNILTRQLSLAFRRTTTEAEVGPYVELASKALDEGVPFEQALRRGLKGIICAPEFLFFEERLAADKRIDDFALASRLSYFLWSTLPDEELLELGRRGDLHKPALLREQVERLLDDPKSDRFVESFTGQWLRLFDIDFTVPDQTLYPEYDELLRQSMLDETHAFFRELLERDHSVQDFIGSDYVMINEPLAKFYGINGVEGLQIRRVQLPPDSARGGVLTQASVLKVSADGTSTSPVLRGAWILKYLYGTPSPPPPPTVGAIEPDIRGATTIREQLALHRDHNSCNRCHRKIDPPGFALESFDVIGAEREWYRTRGNGKQVKVPRHAQAPNHFVQYRQGLDVDPSGTLPDGRTFADVREYKRLLLEDPTAMPKSLTRLLLTYAVGRRIGFSDRTEVDRIVSRTQESNYGLRSLIHEIVQSDTFRSR
jgi:hypothetical protein